MKLGVMTVPLSQMTAKEAFTYLASIGVETLEIGTGGSPGDAHLKPAQLLEDPNKITEYRKMVDDLGLDIACLSVHNNHVHPNKEIRERAHKEFINTCKVAEKLGVDTVVTFSGCPGDQPNAKYPNWVTCSWPEDYPAILDYQWNEELIPYWQKASKEAADYGINRIAFEMHPGFCVYNPSTLLRIREAVGPSIGANFDPSHLYWQGMDPSEAIKYLEGAIFHFHAKDTQLNEHNIKTKGVLDPSHSDKFTERPWMFRTVGFGHGEAEWKRIISSLRETGYNRAISIEHEDALMSIKEGLESAVNFLKRVIIKEEANETWWNK